MANSNASVFSTPVIPHSPADTEAEPADSRKSIPEPLLEPRARVSRTRPSPSFSTTIPLLLFHFQNRICFVFVEVLLFDHTAQSGSRLL